MTFVLFMLILPLSGPIYPSLREGPLCGGEPAVRPMQVKGGFRPMGTKPLARQWRLFLVVFADLSGVIL